MSIAIVNASTVVPDAGGQAIVSALNKVLPQFCKDWFLAPVTAVYVPRGRTSSIRYKIFLMDSSDSEGALGYHSLSGVPYGKAFASTVLQYGGALLYSSNPAVPTFAQTVCHEVFEMLIDPNVNTWWDTGDTQTMYAAEVSDPVQGNVVTVTLNGARGFNPATGKAAAPVTRVNLSDWILPAWTNPQATQGPFNHNNTLRAPFTLDGGGYAILLENGVMQYTFGAKVPDDKKAAMSAHVER